MQCELCGRECNECRPAEVDSVKMMLCPGCMKHGKGISPGSGRPSIIHDAILDRIKKPREKDIYKNMNKELIQGWNDIIREARKRKGLSREELGFNIGERTVTISKIENGDLRPSDKLIKKIEKNLDIKLIEEVKKVTPLPTGQRSRSGMTIGDIIKTEKK